MSEHALPPPAIFTHDETLHAILLPPLATFLSGISAPEHLVKLNDILIRFRTPKSYHRIDVREVESSELPPASGDEDEGEELRERRRRERGSPVVLEMGVGVADYLLSGAEGTGNSGVPHAQMDGESDDRPPQADAEPSTSNTQEVVPNGTAEITPEVTVPADIESDADANANVQAPNDTLPGGPSGPEDPPHRSNPTRPPRSTSPQAIRPQSPTPQTKYPLPPSGPQRRIRELRLDLRTLDAAALFTLETWRREVLGLEKLDMEYPASIWYTGMPSPQPEPAPPARPAAVSPAAVLEPSAPSPAKSVESVEEKAEVEEAVPPEVELVVVENDEEYQDSPQPEQDSKETPDDLESIYGPPIPDSQATADAVDEDGALDTKSASQYDDLQEDSRIDTTSEVQEEVEEWPKPGTSSQQSPDGSSDPLTNDDDHPSAIQVDRSESPDVILFDQHDDKPEDDPDFVGLDPKLSTAKRTGGRPRGRPRKTASTANQDEAGVKQKTRGEQEPLDLGPGVQLLNLEPDTYTGAEGLTREKRKDMANGRKKKPMSSTTIVTSAATSTGVKRPRQMLEGVVIERKRKRKVVNWMEEEDDKPVGLASMRGEEDDEWDFLRDF